MSNFKNNFSWSLSRHKIFNDCKRRYYLNYYGYWNGWKNNADEKIKKIYMLKNITNRFLLSGSTVHDMIKYVIHNYGNNHHLLFENAKQIMIDKLGRDFLASKNKDWQKKIKGNCNLSEHYYNDNISDDKWIEFRNDAVNSLRSFYLSDEFKLIQNSDMSDWFSIDDIDSFEYYDTKIFAAPDFGFHYNDKNIIYDWKCGKESVDDENQLLVYSLYSKKKWGLDYSSMELYDVYLKAGFSKPATDIENKISNLEKFIKNSIDDMKNLLIDVDNNVAVESDFEMTNNTSKCKWCSFKEICYSNDWKNL